MAVVVVFYSIYGNFIISFAVKIRKNFVRIFNQNSPRKASNMKDKFDLNDIITLIETYLLL